MENENTVNKKDASELLGISMNKLNNMIEKKEIIPIVSSGKTIRFDKTELLKRVEDKTPIIVIANQKGGVLKTTTSLNICIDKIQQGKKVLLLETDPQSNLSENYVIDDKLAKEKSIYRALSGERNLKHCIIEFTKNFHFVPTDFQLSNILVELFSQEAISTSLLAEIIKPIRQEYDYIIIDTPPNQPFISSLALVAATTVIIPTSNGRWSSGGDVFVIDTIKKFIKDRRIKTEIKDVIILPNSVSHKQKLLQFSKSEFKIYVENLKHLADDLVRISDVTIPIIANATDLQDLMPEDFSSFKHELLTVYSKFIKKVGI